MNAPPMRPSCCPAYDFKLPSQLFVLLPLLVLGRRRRRLVSVPLCLASAYPSYTYVQPYWRALDTGAGRARVESNRNSSSSSPSVSTANGNTTRRMVIECIHIAVAVALSVFGLERRPYLRSVRVVNEWIHLGRWRPIEGDWK